MQTKPVRRAKPRLTKIVNIIWYLLMFADVETGDTSRESREFQEAKLFQLCAHA